ncbi:single-stranded DNA-binding protein [Geobacillus stearothermophilus]|nr:single-stranded DNA-binding protein [Geobacillus stearothermophilus]WJQ03237.1 single-stranded DNA-binding protein [Geobacillus stearothermophilus]
MNIITLTGRAVADLELRYTPSGKEVASGVIVVQRDYKNSQGQYESDFIPFIAWGKQGLIMAEHIRKGDFFGITGRLQQRTYQNQEGKNVRVYEVVVSSFDFPVKPKEAPQSGDRQQGKWNGAAQKKDASKTAREALSRPPETEWGNDDPFGGEPVEFNDDDLPF